MRPLRMRDALYGRVRSASTSILPLIIHHHNSGHIVLYVKGDAGKKGPFNHPIIVGETTVKSFFDDQEAMLVHGCKVGALYEGASGWSGEEGRKLEGWEILL